MRADLKKYESLSYQLLPESVISEVAGLTGMFFSGGTMGGVLYHLLKARSVRSALANAPRVGGAFAFYSLLTNSPVTLAYTCDWNYDKVAAVPFQMAYAAATGALMWSPRGLISTSTAALCSTALVAVFSGYHLPFVESRDAQLARTTTCNYVVYKKREKDRVLAAK